MSFLHVVSVVEGRLFKKEMWDGDDGPPVRKNPAIEKAQAEAERQRALAEAQAAEIAARKVERQRQENLKEELTKKACKALGREFTPIYNKVLKYFGMNLPFPFSRKDWLSDLLNPTYRDRVSVHWLVEETINHCGNFVLRKELREAITLRADRQGGCLLADDMFSSELIKKYKNASEFEEYLTDLKVIAASNILGHSEPHKHKEEYCALEQLLAAMIKDPALTPEEYFSNVALYTPRLPDMPGTDKGDYQALGLEAPDGDAARAEMETALAAFSQERIGMSAVISFGAAAQKKAGDAAAQIEMWKIHQNKMMPPSLRALERIVAQARILRNYTGQKPQAEKGWFSRRRRTEEEGPQPLYNAVGMIMREAANLSALADADMEAYDRALEDNDRAAEVLEAHARIILMYSDAFNEAASGLKRHTALVNEQGRRIARFEPQDIDETKIELGKSALRAEQAAAGIAQIHQPLQKYYARTAPKLSWQSADILKAAQEIFRVARLRELADYYRKTGHVPAGFVDEGAQINGADVSSFSNLSAERQDEVMTQAVQKLDDVLKPWAQTVEDVKAVLQIEDYSGKRLMIEYKPEEEAVIGISVVETSKPGAG